MLKIIRINKLLIGSTSNSSISYSKFVEKHNGFRSMRYTPKPALCFNNTSKTQFKQFYNPSRWISSFRVNNSVKYNCGFGSTLPICIHFRNIRITSTNNALHPLIVLILRPLSKVIAVLLGRRIRKWWSKLPDDERKILLGRYQKNRGKIFGYLALIFGPLTGGLLAFYLTHLETNPITQRKRFIAFSKEHMAQMAALEEQTILEEYRKFVLPPTDPVYKKIAKVAQHILKANQDVEEVKDTEWSVVVIGKDDQKNAFVLPNGTIFIFTGLLSICDNEDQLGVVLSHEISHAVLSHMAEQLGNVNIMEFLLLIPVVMIWAIFPDSLAFISHWLCDMFTSTLVHLPFSRQLETEADKVGLQFAAKACFDVRESVVFWNKMRKMELEENPENTNVEFFSTHPSHETRQDVLNQFIPSVIKIREDCKCPKLSDADPRSKLVAERPRAKVLLTTERALG